MSERRVKRTAKDSEGDIVALCGDWGRVEKAEAVRHINGSVYDYFVQDASGRRAQVHVYAGRHLRTDPNSRCADNPDTLPPC
jgi:hypothetical protein